MVSPCSPSRRVNFYFTSILVEIILFYRRGFEYIMFFDISRYVVFHWQSIYHSRNCFRFLFLSTAWWRLLVAVNATPSPPPCVSSVSGWSCIGSFILFYVIRLILIVSHLVMVFYLCWFHRGVSRRLNGRSRHDVTQVEPTHYWSAAAPTTRSALKVHRHARVLHI